MMWTSKVRSRDGTKECAQFQAFHEKPIRAISDNEAIEKSQDFQNPSELFVGFSLFFPNYTTLNLTFNTYLFKRLTYNISSCETINLEKPQPGSYITEYFYVVPRAMFSIASLSGCANTHTHTHKHTHTHTLTYTHTNSLVSGISSQYSRKNNEPFIFWSTCSSQGLV